MAVRKVLLRPFCELKGNCQQSLKAIFVRLVRVPSKCPAAATDAVGFTIDVIEAPAITVRTRSAGCRCIAKHVIDSFLKALEP